MINNLLKSRIYFFSVILFIIIIYFIVYCIQLNKNIRLYIIDNWNIYKCKPYIIPFAGFFRKSNEKLSFWEFTINNFQKCLWSKIKIYFSYFIKPIQYIFSIITKILNNFRKTLNVFRAEAKNIREMFKKIVETIAEKMTNSYAAIQFYQAKMITILKQQMAIFQLLMYFIESMKMTMVSLINGPVIDLVKFLPLFGIALLVLIVVCTLCLFGGPFVKMVACPICLVCFKGDTKCLMKDGDIKDIKDVKLNEKLYEGYVTSTFIINIENKKCDMYKYKDIIVSGSHIIYEDTGNINRVENLRESIKINYSDNFIYCLNTSSRYIYVQNDKKNIIKCSDFFENTNSLHNQYSQHLIKNKLNNCLDKIILDYNNIHDYEWGLDKNTLVLVQYEDTYIYKKIKDILIGDVLIGGGKVYGLVHHSVFNIRMYKYKELYLSGTQLVLENNKWIRVYESSVSKLIKNYDKIEIIHIICENHFFTTKNNIKLRDYLELTENDDVFEEILKNNIDSVILREKNKNTTR